MRVGELLEVLWQIKHVFLFADFLVELLHFHVGLLADDEHCDPMVGLDIVEVGDEGGNELEDEHNVVPSPEIQLFIVLEGQLLLFFQIGLQKQSIHVRRLSDVIVVHFLELDALNIEGIFV